MKNAVIIAVLANILLIFFIVFPFEAFNILLSSIGNGVVFIMPMLSMIVISLSIGAVLLAAASIIFYLLFFVIRVIELYFPELLVRFGEKRRVYSE